MRTVEILFGRDPLRLELPDTAEVLRMGRVAPLAHPAAAVERALEEPIGCDSLESLARRTLGAKPAARAVIVVSDHTRPVPYRGEGGILWPILRRLMDCGFEASRLLVLVATGTHAPLSEAQVRALLDPRVFAVGVPVESHDAADPAALVSLGATSSGMEVSVDRRYTQADLRILTGLVESHFVAGASGGRKSICPGLVGEATTYRFHSAEIMDCPAARDLELAGNPCHEMALEAARMVGADFMVNVTLDKEYRPTGVFAGELEQAHLAAFDFLKSYVSIPLEGRYDLVITHGGAVSVNHYQAVKAALAAERAVLPGGRILLVAANTDTNPVGSERYRSLLHLLTLIGPERFRRLLFSRDWTFVPEQWEVQAWAAVLQSVGVEGLVYYSPQLDKRECSVIPGVDGNRYLEEDRRYLPEMDNVQEVVRAVVEETRTRHAATHGAGNEPRIAFLADGPYGIPMPRG
ncbi:MAG: DUF2088 domain-containing protein [Spirochaetales bacterium]|nr:DUF2088 domain-containing protein [Spirochaetales bacterium]